jgi:cell division septum initiation protein DivIVA
MEFESIDVEKYSFDVVRKGYDRLQVEDFLTKISRAMARLDERRKLAEVRTEKAERELVEVRSRAETTIQETVAARAQLLASAGDERAANREDDSLIYTAERAQIEAHQIIEKANHHATSIHAEAEAVLAGALSTSAKINDDRSEVLGSVNAEREALLAAAREEASTIRTEAVEEAERAKSDGATRAEEIRRQAESDATEMLSEARSRSVEITAHAERNREELLATAARADAAVAATARSGGEPLIDPTPPSAQEPEPGDVDQISVDLRDDSEERELAAARREPRASRYRSRSANLPSLGADAGSVIGGLESLRTKDEKDD